MTGKVLIVIGLSWFAAVVLWLLLSPRSFGYMWHAEGATKRAAVIAGIYIFGLLYQVFVIGWLVPLAFGIYRLMRHR
jgi:predicted ABC-type sugar transport system permease subunit